MSVDATTEGSSLTTNSASLLDRGLSVKLRRRQFDRSEQKHSHFKRVWRSDMSGRIVLPEYHRTIGPYPIGQELLLQCEVLHGEKLSLLDMNISIFDLVTISRKNL